MPREVAIAVLWPLPHTEATSPGLRHVGAGLLDYPAFVGMIGRRRDDHLLRLQLDEHQDKHVADAFSSHYALSEEVTLPERNGTTASCRSVAEAKRRKYAWTSLVMGLIDKFRVSVGSDRVYVHRR